MAADIRAQIASAIRVSERLDLKVPRVQSQALLLTAIAAAFVREIAALRFRIPNSVNWVATSCRPLEPASWLGVDDLSVAGEVGEVIPQPLTLPKDFLDITFGADPGRSGQSGRLTAVRGVVNAGEGIPPYGALYGRRSVISVINQDDDVEVTWLLGASSALDASQQAQVEAAMDKVDALVADRLSFGMGSYRPIAAIMASVDDGFQDALLRAREVDGLPGFLSRLAEGTIGSGGFDAAATVPSEAETDQPEVATVSADLLLLEITQAFDVAAEQVQLHYSAAGPVSDANGSWSAVAEIPTGMGGLRTRTAYVQVCRSELDIHRSLRCFFASSRIGTRRLLLLLDHEMHRQFPVLSDAWRSFQGVHIERLQG